MIKLNLIVLCLFLLTSDLKADDGKKDTLIIKKDRIETVKLSNDSILENTKEIDQKINSLSEKISTLQNKNAEYPETEFLFIKILIIGLILLQILTSILIFSTKKQLKDTFNKNKSSLAQSNEPSQNFLPSPSPSLGKIKELIEELEKQIGGQLKNLNNLIDNNTYKIDKLLSLKSEPENQSNLHNEKPFFQEHENESPEIFIKEYNDLIQTNANSFSSKYQLKTLNIPIDNNPSGILTENLAGLLWLYYDTFKKEYYILFNKSKTLTNIIIAREGLINYFEFTNFEKDKDIVNYRLKSPAIGKYEDNNYLFKGTKGLIELYY